MVHRAPPPACPPPLLPMQRVCHYMLTLTMSRRVSNRRRRQPAAPASSAAAPAAAPAVQAEPSPPSSPSGPLSQLVIAAEQKAASDTEEAAPHSDADAEVSPRERARKKLGHYQPKLSSLDRLEVCTTTSSACPRTRRI